MESASLRWYSLTEWSLSVNGFLSSWSRACISTLLTKESLVNKFAMRSVSSSMSYIYTHSWISYSLRYSRSSLISNDCLNVLLECISSINYTNNWLSSFWTWSLAYLVISVKFSLSIFVILFQFRLELTDFHLRWILIDTVLTKIINEVLWHEFTLNEIKVLVELSHLFSLDSK